MMSSTLQAGVAGPYQNESLNKIYDLLFCDDLESFRPANDETKNYPWDIVFATQPKEASLIAVTKDAQLETRLHLLAHLRLQRELNFSAGQELLGVIIEVAMEEGMDVLAAYRDGTARYINYSEKIIIWDSTSDVSARLIDHLFVVSKEVVSKIGPWDKERLAPPAKNMIRMSFLVTDGLYFGQGPFVQLAKDPMASPVIDAATMLMNFLTTQP